MREAKNFDAVICHTSTPSFPVDVKVVEALKAAKPDLKVGLIGAKVAVDPDGSLKASQAIDFVAREEFDFTVKELAEGRDWKSIQGMSYRNAEGRSFITRTAPSSKTWINCRLSRRSTSAI